MQSNMYTSENLANHVIVNNMSLATTVFMNKFVISLCAYS
jgi:hypothetical protein